MPKATKRERQRQNRDIRRQAMQQAETRRKRLHTARNIGLVLLPIVLIFVGLQVFGGSDDDSSTSTTVTVKSASGVTCSGKVPPEPTSKTYDAPPTVNTSVPTDTAKLNTSCGAVEIELAADVAPQTVASFVALAQDGFYNGTSFHRIVTDFVDQGGDPKGTGSGGPGYTLPDEPPPDGFKVGDVAMANSGPGTTGSQFFLVVSESAATTLNSGGAPYKYSFLGRMTGDGLKVAKKINSFGSSGETGTPTAKIYIDSISFVVDPSTSTTTSAP